MLTNKTIEKCANKAGLSTIRKNANINDSLIIGTMKEWSKFDELMDVVDEYMEDQIDLLIENAYE